MRCHSKFKTGNRVSHDTAPDGLTINSQNSEKPERLKRYDRPLLILSLIFTAFALLLWQPLAWRAWKVTAGAAEAAVYLFAAYGWGRVLTRRLAAEPDNPVQTAPPAWNILVGTGIIAILVYVAAAFNVYHPLFAAALLLLGCGMAARNPPVSLQCEFRINWEAAPGLTALFLALGTPVVFWDSCSYHLAIPEYMNFQGGLISKISYMYGFYPQAMESVYATLLWMPYGETACQVLNVSFFVLAVVAAFSSIPRELRTNTLTLAACVPGLVILAFLPKNTALMALSGVVAFEAMIRIDPQGGGTHGAGPRGRDLPASRLPLQKQSPSSRFHASIAGIALGVGMATHYGSLWTLLALLPVIAWRAGTKNTLRALFFLALFSGATYLRNFIVTGNPMYPFLSFLFGAERPSWFSIGTDEGGLPLFLVLQRAVLPWTSVEQLGLGSTLGIVIPLGILTAWLLRRERSVSQKRMELLRFIVGTIILVAGTVIHSRPRYGITGFFILLPLAAAGLASYRGFVRPLLLIHSLIAALLVLESGFMPLKTLWDMSEDNYRAHYDHAYPIAAFADAHLPLSARIASVGILRPYHWKGRIEPSCEYHAPAIAKILAGARDGPAAAEAFQKAGYGYFAVDMREWRRLAKEYGYLVLSPEQAAVFKELISGSEKIADSGDAALYRIPISSAPARAEQTAASATTSPS